jgi:hypothetical protein
MNKSRWESDDERRSVIYALPPAALGLRPWQKLLAALDFYHHGTNEVCDVTVRPE